MGGRADRFGLAAVLGAAVLLLGAAVRPGGIAAARPGLWDVSPSATGANAQRLCLPDPEALAQWESRGAACTRSRLTEDANVVTFAYRCTGGDFGRSTITLLTPRSLRVETQGISRGQPFDYVVHARHVGACEHR